jgi:transcriptional regulator with GAF, ATPase, and Fis domain
VLSDGKLIDYTDLPVEVRFSALPGREPTPEEAAAASGGSVRFVLPAQGINLEEVERDFIVQAMEMSGGVIAKAAKLLGLSYRTLQYRLDKFQIRRESGEVSVPPEDEGGGPPPTGR